MNLIIFGTLVTFLSFVALFSAIESRPVTAEYGLLNYSNSNLGIAFQYPNNWRSPTEQNEKDCLNPDSCGITFSIKNFIIGIRINKLNGNSDDASLEKLCLCSNLKDYIKWDYNRLYKENDVLADNQTNVGNYSAWQMDVFNKDNGYKTLVTWMIDNNLGYRFIYTAPANGNFSQYLNGYKDLLKSLVITGAKESIPLTTQKPSFLSNSKPSNPLDLPSNSNASAKLNATNIPVISEDDFGIKNGTELYSDQSVGFMIKYPSDWTVDNKDTSHNTVVSFVSADSEASVDIRIFPQSTYKSLRDFGNNFKEDDDLTLLAYYRNSTTLLDWKPAFKAIYLTTYNPNVFENALGYTSSTSKAMFTATLVPEKKSYLALAYFADPGNFDDYLPVVEQMIKSVQIGSQGPVVQEED